MLHKLLMVAFHYPPVRGSSGIQRTLKFSTYLRDQGWEPMVLTVAPQAFENVTNDQLDEIPKGLQVVRAFGLNTARHLAWRGRYPGWLAQPDRWFSWWPAAIWHGLQMIWHHRPAAIMSTAPIATAHLIGLTLQRLSGLPWIADCRDSMTEPGYPVDKLTWKTNRWLERAVVTRASRVVFTTEGTRQMYAMRYPAVPAARWAVIENGFDEDNFRMAEEGFTPKKLGCIDQITLVHSGILYPQERDPVPFFCALRKLKDNKFINAQNLRIVLRASGSETMYRKLLSDYDVADLVELAPAIDYRSALQEMLCAEGLLIFQSAMCNHQIPAKLYEYMRAGRPILALTDPVGSTAASLRLWGGAAIADIADKHDIEHGLLKFIAGIRSGSITGVSAALSQAYSRQARTKELAQLLNEVIK